MSPGRFSDTYLHGFLQRDTVITVNLHKDRALVLLPLTCSIQQLLEPALNSAFDLDHAFNSIFDLTLSLTWLAYYTHTYTNTSKTHTHTPWQFLIVLHFHFRLDLLKIHESLRKFSDIAFTHRLLDRWTQSNDFATMLWIQKAFCFLLSLMQYLVLCVQYTVLTIVLCFHPYTNRFASQRYFVCCFVIFLQRICVCCCSCLSSLWDVVSSCRLVA